MSRSEARIPLARTSPASVLSRSAGAVTPVTVMSPAEECSSTGSVERRFSVTMSPALVRARIAVPTAPVLPCDLTETL